MLLSIIIFCGSDLFFSKSRYCLALILKSLCARSVVEQRLIYEQNRPFPKLGLQCGVRKFRFEWYGKEDWLCGSEGKQRFFLLAMFTF